MGKPWAELTPEQRATYLERARARRLQDPDAHRARRRARYAARLAADPERVLAERREAYRRAGQKHSAKWRRQNPERAKELQREYRERHRERVRDARLKRDFGIGLCEYERLLAAQANVCAICRRPERRLVDRKTGRVRQLAVDHCHESGRVRGLLCVSCNTALGLLEHEPRLLESAAAYLTRPT